MLPDRAAADVGCGAIEANATAARTSAKLRMESPPLERSVVFLAWVRRRRYTLWYECSFSLAPRGRSHIAGFGMPQGVGLAGQLCQRSADAGKAAPGFFDGIGVPGSGIAVRRLGTP